ncbi:hypothetical protein K435DRAFT_229617 [Dendrothele bispora CBS 962.96]|uniref:Uncharacterized protein n=1 Tax=Dendrothele bispora (strain CBS 962.96) TaxID=1314807 RepID=A0A4S8MM30_DENBC|nr:hypothetical protein K435DRAFT_229617 [Dendrothele bispora CBS 962.96]
MACFLWMVLSILNLVKRVQKNHKILNLLMGMASRNQRKLLHQLRLPPIWAQLVGHLKSGPTMVFLSSNCQKKSRLLLKTANFKVTTPSRLVKGPRLLHMSSLTEALRRIPRRQPLLHLFLYPLFPIRPLQYLLRLRLPPQIRA